MLTNPPPQSPNGHNSEVKPEIPVRVTILTNSVHEFTSGLIHCTSQYRRPDTLARLNLGFLQF